jgi:Carboxypeptidase regulatory-like domain
MKQIMQRCFDFSGIWNFSYKPMRGLSGTMTVRFARTLLAKANPQRCKRNGRRGYLPPLRVLTGSVATLFLWGLMAGALANAQSTGRANLTGVVTDTKGSVIEGAQITVTNMGTNVSSVSVTNNTGYFEIDSLDAATYKVTATAKGFEGLVQNGVELRASSVVSLPLTLNVGEASEVITVTAETPLIDPSSALTGQSMTTREVQSLPTADNDPMEFAEIAPGVQSPAGITQAYSIDGAINWNGVSKFGTAGVSNSNEFDIDGATNSGNTRGNAITMNTDMTDEVRIDTTGFDPTIGHTYGITMTETTKSGTNGLHGSATQLYSERRWDAMNRFQALTYAHQQRVDDCTKGPSTSPQCFADENKYGWPGVHENLTTFGIGGPVIIPKLFDGRNKFFFFVGGTNDSLTDATQSTATVPTVQERSGNFSDLPTATLPAAYAAAFNAACGANTPYYGQYQLYDPYSVTMVNGHPSRTPLCGNVVPSGRMLNPQMANMVNSWLPTPTNSNVNGNNYVYTSPSPEHFFQITARVDYALSENDRIFVRFTRQTFTQALPGIAPDGIDTRQGPKWVEIGALGWNHVFNSSTNLDVTLAGANMETTYNHYPGYSASPPSSVGLPSYLDQYAGASATFPMLEFGSPGSTNTYAQGTSGANSSLFGNLNYAPSFYRTANVRANLTHVHGEHTIRVGGEWRAQNFSRGIMGNSSGIFNFDTTYTQQNDGTNADCTGAGCSLGVPSPSNYGLSYAAFLMGVQTTSTVNQQAPISISTPYYSAYAGDTWRVTPKLTFLPGVRFEEEYGPKEKHNDQITEFDPNQSLAIASPAMAAYATSFAGATPAQQAVMPSTIAVAGGPLYAGVNGAPVRQWTSNFRVLPRIGASYRLPHDTLIHGGYGLFFDTLNALEFSGTPTDQTNFTASTVDQTNAFYGNFGQNLSTAAPPISNPFPVTNGANFLSAVGSAAGNLSYLGANPTIYPHDFVPARAQRVQIGAQHQFGKSLMVDVSWLGSWSSHMSNFSSGLVNAGGGANTQSQNLDSVPASFFAGGDEPNIASSKLLGTLVSNPFNIANFASLKGSNLAAYNEMLHSGIFTNSTTPLSNVVRPYGFMSGLSEENPIGQSHFQELQVTVIKHMSQGVDFTVAYQKNYQYDRDYFANPFDTAMSWEPSNTSLPSRLTAEAMYELPFGRGKEWANSGWTSAIFGGFRVNATYELNNGTLLEWGNLFYVGNIKASDIMLKHPVYNTNVASGTFNVQWLNPANVATATVNSDGSCSYSGTGFVNNSSCQPNGYNLRAFPTRVNGVRQQAIDNTNANVQRSFKIKEGVALELRFDAANVFNHQNLGTPNETVTSSQFGQITATQNNARFVDIQGHISF